MSYSGFLNTRLSAQIRSYLGNVPRDSRNPLFYRISIDELAGTQTSALKKFFQSAIHADQRVEGRVAVLFPTCIKGLPCTHLHARIFIQELTKECPGFVFFCNLEGKGLWNIVLCLLNNLTCVDSNLSGVSLSIRRAEFLDLTHDLIWDGITQARLQGCTEAEIDALAGNLRQYFSDWSRNCLFD